MESRIDDPNLEYRQYVDAVYLTAAKYRASVEETLHMFVNTPSFEQEKQEKLVKYMKDTRCDKAFMDKLTNETWSDMLKKIGYKEREIIPIDKVDIFQSITESSNGDNDRIQNGLKKLLAEYVQSHPSNNLYQAIQAIIKDYTADVTLDKALEEIGQSMGRTTKLRARAFNETKALFLRSYRDQEEMGMYAAKFKCLRDKIAASSREQYDEVSQTLQDFEIYVNKYRSRNLTIASSLNDYLKEQYEEFARLSLEGEDLTAFSNNLTTSIMLIRSCEEDQVQLKRVIQHLNDYETPTKLQGIQLIQNLAKKQQDIMLTKIPRKTIDIAQLCNGRPEAEAWCSLIKLKTFNSPYGEVITINAFKSVFPKIESFELIPGVSLISILEQSADDEKTVSQIINDYIEDHGSELMESINQNVRAESYPKAALEKISTFYSIPLDEVKTLYERALDQAQNENLGSGLMIGYAGVGVGSEYATAIRNLSIVENQINELFSNNHELLVLAKEYIHLSKNELLEGAKSKDPEVLKKFSDEKINIINVISNMIKIKPEIEPKMKAGLTESSDDVKVKINYNLSDLTKELSLRADALKKSEMDRVKAIDKTIEALEKDIRDNDKKDIRHNANEERIFKIASLSKYLGDFAAQHPEKALKISKALTRVLRDEEGMTFDKMIIMMSAPHLAKGSPIEALRDAMGQHRSLFSRFINLFYRTETNTIKFFKDNIQSYRPAEVHDEKKTLEERRIEKKI